MPRQAVGALEITAKIEIFDEYMDGLTGPDSLLAKNYYLSDGNWKNYKRYKLEESGRYHPEKFRVMDIFR